MDEHNDDYDYGYDPPAPTQSMVVLLRNNTTLEVTFPDSSLKIELKYVDSDLVVLANHADIKGRVDEIYKTGEWDGILPCCC